MEEIEVGIPIVCKNNKSENYENLVNFVHGIKVGDTELFYESYDNSVDSDHCLLFGELGIVEDAYLIPS